MKVEFKFKKPLITFILLLVIFFAAGFCGFMFLKNKFEDVAFLKGFILEKYGLILNCDEIKGNFKGLNFNVESPHISVFAKDSNIPFIKINDFCLEVKLAPFMLKKAAVKNIKASSITANFNRLKDGSFDFSKYIKIKNSFALTLDLSDTKASVSDYELHFNDLYTDITFNLKGDKFISDGLDPQKKFSIYTGGNLRVNDKISNYIFDIDFIKNNDTFKLNKQEILLSDFNTSFLKKYLYKYNVISTDSVIDIYSAPSDKKDYKLLVCADKINWSFKYKNEINKIQAEKPVVVDADFNFTDENLLIKQASFLTDNVNIQYFGKIKNLLSFKEIEPELDVKITNSDFQNMIKLLPDTLFPFQEPYVQSLKKYNVNAFLNGGAHVKFKNMNDFSVEGKLNFDDVYIAERPKTAETSFGECEFKGRDVLITVFANAPNDAVLTICGKTRMQKSPTGEFDIKSTGSLDLAFAHKILMPVQKILNLKLGPLPFMQLKGDGSINLHTMGTKEKADLNGQFQTNNATVTLEGLNTVLTNGKITILFNNDKIEFKGASGIIKGSKAFIDGICDTSGNILIDVNIKNISAVNALNIAQASPIITEALGGGEFLKSFRPKTGNVDFYLNLSGNVPPDAVFGQQTDFVKAKGELIFKGINLNVEPKIQASNLKGTLTFENSADFDLTANIFESPFIIKGKVYQKGAQNKVLKDVPSTLDIRFISDKIFSNSIGKFMVENIELFIPQNRLFVNNLARIFMTNKFDIKADVAAVGLVQPDSSEIDLSGFNFTGNIKGVNKNNSDFRFEEGNIELKNKNAKFNNLKINAAGIDFLINGTIDKFVSTKPYNNLKLTFYNSQAKDYAELFKKILPEKAAYILNSIQDIKGNISGKVKLTGDKIEGEFIPSLISVSDTKTKQDIILKDGRIKLKNDKTYFDKFNVMYGKTPFYIDGYIQTDGRENPGFNLFVSTNLTEEDCDNLINPYLKYPFLLTGETALKGRLQGNLNSYTAYLTTTLNEGSDLSFMGLKIGDTETKREIASKIKFKGNYADINYIKYFKYVLSQNNKQGVYELININGGIKLSKNNIVLNNLRFYTPNPAPVRFLNPLFKKSLIKEGLFTSDLILNGNISNFVANGTLSFSKVFLPVYESVIDNIKINLKNKTGRAEFDFSAFKTKGDIAVDFENKITLPVIINNIAIHSSSVSIDNLLKAFAAFADSASVDKDDVLTSSGQISFKPSDIQIKKGSIVIDEIDFNNVTANNLKMNFSHSKDASLEIDDAYLNIAGGLIKGSGGYKFGTKDINIKSDFLNCDADELSKAFFNLSGEIYGSANGSFTVSMKDFTIDNYINKINVDAEFTIINGRLPKLGSIEYLLRASNFFKSGIFGLTINNVIELLTPYKHGDFNKITGDLKVSDAKIKDLKIYSQGDNLSTYTFGTYDIAAGTGDIEILGKLSKKISNILGPIGNASVVSILNVVTRNKMDELVKTEMLKNVSKIPLMSLSNDEYRLFNAKIKGEVRADNIVKSFNWLN